MASNSLKCASKKTFKADISKQLFRTEKMYLSFLFLWTPGTRGRNIRTELPNTLYFKRHWLAYLEYCKSTLVCPVLYEYDFQSKISINVNYHKAWNHESARLVKFLSLRSERYIQKGVGQNGMRLKGMGWNGMRITKDEKSQNVSSRQDLQEKGILLLVRGG